jgi:hypothetical protein
MPYIDKRLRGEFDPYLNALSAVVREAAKKQGYDGAHAGMLNYCCTRLIDQLLPEQRYHAYGLMIGVLETMKLEYYRRRVALYEDSAKEKNGDVF